MNDFDKVYTAGLFDGEGSITIEKPRKSRSFTLSVRLGLRDKRPIDWLYSVWNGRIALTKTPNDSPFFIWAVSSASAGLFLKDILPFLKIKSDQAQLAVELQSLKRNFGNAHVPITLLHRWSEIRDQVILLNKTPFVGV